MKNRHASRSIALIVGLSTLSVTPAAWSRVSHARELFGVVEKVDLAHHVFVLQPDATTPARRFSWGSETVFTESHTNVTAAVLVAGQRVSVSYYAPFFGKPFALRLEAIGKKPAPSAK